MSDWAKRDESGRDGGGRTLSGKQAPVEIGHALSPSVVTPLPARLPDGLTNCLLSAAAAADPSVRFDRPFVHLSISFTVIDNGNIRIRTANSLSGSTAAQFFPCVA